MRRRAICWKEKQLDLCMGLWARGTISKNPEGLHTSVVLQRCHSRSLLALCTQVACTWQSHWPLLNRSGSHARLRRRSHRFSRLSLALADPIDQGSQFPGRWLLNLPTGIASETGRFFALDSLSPCRNDRLHSLAISKLVRFGFTQLEGNFEAS